MANSQKIFYSALIIIAGFIFWITFLILYKNEAIPYITECPNGAPCDLTNYGALIIGLIASMLVAILIWKSQAAHSERLAKLSRSVTEKIYARAISHYGITLKYYNEDNDVVATENALERFQNLVDLLVQQGSSVKDAEVPGKGKVKEITFDDGATVKITIPKMRELMFTKASVRAAELYLQTNSYKLLNKIITENKLVYHHLEWYIVDPYPVDSIMNKVKNNSFDSSECAFEDIIVDVFGDTKTYSVSDATIYDIIKLKEIEICVAIHQHKMNLICSYEGARQGFYRAHVLLAPAKIIPILFGEISNEEIKELFENAMKLEKN